MNNHGIHIYIAATLYMNIFNVSPLILIIFSFTIAVPWLRMGCHYSFFQTSSTGLWFAQKGHIDQQLHYSNENLQSKKKVTFSGSIFHKLSFPKSYFTQMGSFYWIQNLKITYSEQRNFGTLDLSFSGQSMGNNSTSLTAETDQCIVVISHSCFGLEALWKGKCKLVRCSLCGGM